jgi:pimeloyl-ACP methyl ester carboxylesterase
METTVSKDGTRIAYERVGVGPPVILVDGAFCSRAFGPMPKLAPLLAQQFTVIYYDRRGRGQSGDTPPYAVEREVEDLQALFAAAGGSPYLFGISSGAVLALRAAASGAEVRKLLLYEPPITMADSPPPVQPDLKPQIIEMVAAGRRGDAVKTFMKMVGVPPIFIFLMRIMPNVLPKLTAVAHTLPYDFAAMGDTDAGKPLPTELIEAMGSVKAPTLVVAGGKSPAWMHHTAQVVTNGIPQAEKRTLDGQDHNVAPKAIAPVLKEYFS